MKTLPQPWSAAMEATMFSGWIRDHWKPLWFLSGGGVSVVDPYHAA
jgi:hypothetical protein